jgi:hypothetical protein
MKNTGFCSDHPPVYFLRTLPADATGQLNVLGHDRHTFRMNGAKIGVFKESHQVGFGGLLQRQHGTALEAEITLEVLGNFTDQALEGELANQQIGTLLVPTNLPEGDRTRTVAMGLLDSARGRSRLASGLGGQLLAGSCNLLKK